MGARLDAAARERAAIHLERAAERDLRIVGLAGIAPARRHVEDPLIRPLLFQNAIDSGIDVSFIQNRPRISLVQRNAIPEPGASARLPLRPCASWAGVTAISTRTRTVGPGVRITAVPCGNVTAADSASVARMPSTDTL